MADVYALTQNQNARIAKTVQAYESQAKTGAGWHPYRGDDGGDPVRLGKTTASWSKGTTATIELYEEGTPPNETKKSPTADTLTGCVNKFATVASGKWVIVARGGNGSWYLIAAEC